MKPRIFIFSAITLLLFIPEMLPARKAEMAILPFQVSGRPDPKLFSLPDLPEQIQEATHFLFRIRKDYALKPLLDTRLAQARAGWRPDQILDRSRSNRLCIETGSSYLLAGQVHFLDRRSLLISMVSYSCSAGRRVARANRKGDLNRLQGFLRELLDETVPFAPVAEESSFITSSAGDGVDLTVILDLSGSMVPELEGIYNGLASSMERLPGKSRLGMILLEGEGKKEILPLTEKWGDSLAIARKRGAGGEVGSADLEEALHEVARNRDWQSKKKLVIFSDASLDRGGPNRVESRLRSLMSGGMEIGLFNLLSLKERDRLEWRRIARSLSLPDPGVLYGRRVGFLQGYSLYLIQEGERFYRSREDVGKSILRGDLDVERLVPLETIQFDRNSINLNDLPYKYAELEHLKVVGLGEILSDLEIRIHRFVLSGTAQGRAPFMALVKNEGRSFWIQISDQDRYEELKESLGRTLYLGLSFQWTGNGETGLVNLPGRIYPVDQGEVPRLLINHMDHIQRLGRSSIDPRDIWFFLVKIKEVKDAEGTRDIRE